MTVHTGPRLGLVDCSVLFAVVWLCSANTVQLEASAVPRKGGTLGATVAAFAVASRSA